MEMINGEELQKMREKSMREVDQEELVDLKQIKIDRSLPVPERVVDYIRQIRNPYLFKVDNVIVKLNFKEDGSSCQEALYGMIDVIR